MEWLGYNQETRNNQENKNKQESREGISSGSKEKSYIPSKAKEEAYNLSKQSEGDEYLNKVLPGIEDPREEKLKVDLSNIYWAKLEYPEWSIIRGFTNEPLKNFILIQWNKNQTQYGVLINKWDGTYITQSSKNWSINPYDTDLLDDISIQKSWDTISLSQIKENKRLTWNAAKISQKDIIDAFK